MTTETPKPGSDAAALAAGLSEGERAALEHFVRQDRFNIDLSAALNSFDKLFLKGLLQKTSFDMGGVVGGAYYTILEVGREVLAASDTPPAPESANGVAGIPETFDLDGVEYALAMLSAEFIGKKDAYESVWLHLRTIEEAWREEQAELKRLAHVETENAGLREALKPIVEDWIQLGDTSWFEEQILCCAFSAEMFSHATKVYKAAALAASEKAGLT